MILGFYAGKSHNLIGLGIFHGDLDFFDLHEKSLDLSNYEIFLHKILKSRTFKKEQYINSYKTGFLLAEKVNAHKLLYIFFSNLPDLIPSQHVELFNPALLDSIQATLMDNFIQPAVWAEYLVEVVGFVRAL